MAVVVFMVHPIAPEVIPSDVILYPASNEYISILVAMAMNEHTLFSQALIKCDLLN